MKKILALALSAVLMTSVLTGCSGDSGSEITLYDGINSEMQLIHKMVELLVEEHTDAEVEILDQMAAVSNFKDLSSDNPSCELMNCYDGVLLTSYLKIDPSEVPEGISTTTPTRLRKNSTRFTCWIRLALTTPMPSA